MSNDPRFAVETWLQSAGAIALASFGQARSTYKGDGTPVTQADVAVEAFLVDHIRRAFPSHAILSEEGLRLGPAESDYLWVLDPLDGTRAFSVGLPIWGIGVALLHHHQPLFGAYYQPYVRELYWAETGAEPLLNAQSLRGRLLTTWDDRASFLAVPSNVHRHFQVAFPRVRALGSTLAHLAYLVRGAAIGVLTRPVCLWDLAPCLPLLWAAGGQAVYLSGRPIHLDELANGRPAPEPIVAAHPDLIDRIRADLRPMTGSAAG